MADGIKIFFNSVAEAFRIFKNRSMTVVLKVDIFEKHEINKFLREQRRVQQSRIGQDVEFCSDGEGYSLTTQYVHDSGIVFHIVDSMRFTEPGYISPVAEEIKKEAIAFAEFVIKQEDGKSFEDFYKDYQNQKRSK